MRVITLVAGLVLATCSTAMAAPAYTVVHNGSLMLVTPVARNEIVIQYANPRPSLIGLVQPGTVLVRGYWQGDIFSGTAFVFSRWCGAIPYVVRGTTDQANSLVLIGAAPQFDTNCRILGYDPTSAHAVLRFELVEPATAPPPPVAVAPLPPPPSPPVAVAQPPPPPATAYPRWLGLD
jgi:hypothetical protein